MASIYKRKSKDGKSAVWRAAIRMKGYPTVCNHFERKQEADDWVKDTERRIKLGQYNFETTKTAHTYADAFDRLVADGALEHHKSLKNIQAQYDYWLKRLGAYALIRITPELIAQERQLLANTPNHKGTKPSPSTVNRYMATLSSAFSYAVKQLRWLHENPCKNLLKLKEESGRDRILSDDEITRLLDACRQSKSPYLYPIVLFALTTGARRGEILNLESISRKPGCRPSAAQTLLTTIFTICYKKSRIFEIGKPLLKLHFFVRHVHLLEKLVVRSYKFWRDIFHRRINFHHDLFFLKF